MSLVTRSVCVRAALAIALGLAWVTAPPPALAQRANYALAWGSPTGHYNVEYFECGGGDATHRLFVTITPQENITGLIDIDAVVRVQHYYYFEPGRQPPPLSPFWHFEDGGCNAGGLVIRVPTLAEANGVPEVFPSSHALAASYYAPDYPTIGVGRIVASVFHAQGLGVNLVAGRKYVAFELDFSMCAGVACVGCGDSICIAPSDVALQQPDSISYANSGLDGQTSINAVFACTAPVALGGAGEATATLPAHGPAARGPGLLANLGPAFHALPQQVQPCDVVPVLRRTWGTLKILYR